MTPTVIIKSKNIVPRLIISVFERVMGYILFKVLVTPKDRLQNFLE